MEERCRQSVKPQWNQERQVAVVQENAVYVVGRALEPVSLLAREPAQILCCCCSAVRPVTIFPTCLDKDSHSSGQRHSNSALLLFHFRSRSHSNIGLAREELETLLRRLPLQSQNPASHLSEASCVSWGRILLLFGATSVHSSQCVRRA
jgi:hypothetical protein